MLCTSVTANMWLVDGVCMACALGQANGDLGDGGLRQVRPARHRLRVLHVSSCTTWNPCLESRELPQDTL